MISGHQPAAGAAAGQRDVKNIIIITLWTVATFSISDDVRSTSAKEVWPRERKRPL